MPTFIGLVGEKRGGKGAFTEILRKLLPDRKIIRVSFGDIVGDLLDILGKPRTREEMQKLPIILIEGYKQPDVITHAMKKRLEDLGKHNPDIIILDGIRTWQDLEMLRSFPKNLLVYITACLETRYGRALISGEKVGESALSKEEFAAQDRAEIERLIPEIGKRHDYRITNERTLNDYKTEVKIFVTLHLENTE